MSAAPPQDMGMDMTTHTTTGMGTTTGMNTTTRMGTTTDTCMAPAAGTITNTIMATAEAAAGRELALYVWLSPAFPVGAFAYSHGLEWAVEAGDIHDLASLSAWLDDLCDFGAPRADAILFARAFDAARAGDGAELAELNALAVALAGSRERRLETTAQGGAFIVAARAAWPCAALDHFPEPGGDPVAYPVAIGAAAAGHGFTLEAALAPFVVSLFANFVSAAVRLGAIGQTDGQRALAQLLPRLHAMAQVCARADIDAIGGAAFRSDLAAILHETQYSRLFRS